MLSILIPIYNFDVRKFVKELHFQGKDANIIFEIILVDDTSDINFQEINNELENLEFVKYIQLEQNIGRSKIRNLLAEKSKYEYLLFADCDTNVKGKNFIKKYLDKCKGEVVICGGITYEKEKPSNNKEYLRWFYGTKREAKSVEERNKFSNRSFMTGNYLISKSIQRNIKFNENISEYGHEDTLFGIELTRKGVNIQHIDSPLIHLGLETCSEFIAKTKKGIDNLKYLINSCDYPELYEDIRLLKAYKKTARFSFLFKLFFNFTRKLSEKNLCSKFPFLKLFDLYKLGYLHSIK